MKGYKKLMDIVAMVEKNCAGSHDAPDPCTRRWEMYFPVR